MKSAPSVAMPTYFLASLALAFREVSRQPFFGVLAFASQIGLQLEHGPAEQSVDAPTDFGHRFFEVDVLAVGTKTTDEEPVQQHADLFVTGPRGEFRDQSVSDPAPSARVDHQRMTAAIWAFTHAGSISVWAKSSPLNRSGSPVVFASA